MSYRRTEIAVGVFLLLGICLVLWGIFKTGGYALGPTRSHYSSYENVNTIEPGSAVKYNGMLVGRVSKVSVDSERPRLIRVDYDISAQTGILITDRMEAKITKADLLGDEYIDIRVAGAAMGSSEALTAEGNEILAGSEVPAGEPFDLQRALEDLQGTIGRVDTFLDTAQVEVEAAAAEIQAILKDAHDMVSPENRDNIAAALEDVASTTASLRSLLADNKDQVASIVASVGAAAGNLDTVSEDVKDTVATLRPDLEELAAKLQAAVSQLQAAATSATDTLDAVDVEQVNEVVENLDTVSRNLVEFTDEIKQRPYRLIRKGKQPPKEFQ